MFFSTNLILCSIVGLLMTAVQVTADIVAFSGDLCDGGQGDNVPCDDKCNDFLGRHSFRVLTTNAHCVTLYENKGCSNPVGAIVNQGNAACSNVNTGTSVLSFRCSPNSFCTSAVASGSSLKNATTIDASPAAGSAAEEAKSAKSV